MPTYKVTTASGSYRVTTEDSQNVSRETSGRQNRDKALLMAGAGLGSAGVAGLGAHIGKKYFLDPINERNAANNELKNMGITHGVDPKTAPEFVPRAISGKIPLERASGQSKINSVNQSTSTQIKSLGNNLKNFDSNDVPKASSNLATTIKANLPTVYKTTSDNFGKGLDLADSIADEKGFVLSNKQFSSNVLDRVIEDAQKSGIDEKNIRALESVKESLMGQSKILDAKGNALETPMRLSDAKSVISNLTKDEPYSPLSAKIREHWADFMEKEAPKEVADMYKELNSHYKPFAEARTLLNKLSNPRTGEFDAAGLANYVEKYIKKGSDTGIGKLMDLLGSGKNPLVPKIDSLSGQFDNISNLRKARESIIVSLRDLQNDAPSKMGRIKQENVQKIIDLLSDKAKATELANVAETANARIPWNAAGRVVGKALGLGRKFAIGLPMGAVEGEVQKRAVGYDPAEAISALYKNFRGTPTEKKKLLEDLEKKAKKALEI